MNAQILSLWNCFHSNNVRYITIGGFAVNFYGYSRSTGHIDILIEDTLQNRKRLRSAFKELDLGDFEEIERINFIPGWTDFTLDYGLRLDILTSLKGLETVKFDELYDRAKILEIDKVPVRFIDYYHLIMNKKATNRLKDQLDIEELEKIKKWTEANDKK